MKRKIKDGETPKSRFDGVSWHSVHKKWIGRKQIRDIRRSTNGFDTEDEAHRALLQLVHEYKVLSEKRPTVEEFLGEWFESFRNEVTENTFTTRRNALGPLLPESLVNRKWATDNDFAEFRTALVKDFDDVAFRAFLDQSKRHGIGKRVIEQSWETLKTAWSYAKEHRYVESKELFEVVKKPKYKAKSKEALDEEQRTRLLQAIFELTQTRSRALFLLLFTEGLRINEALGLEWQYVNLAKGSIKIRKQLTKKGTLKTEASYRTLAIQPEVLELFEALKSVSKSPWVFETASHGPMDQNNVRQEILNPMLKRAGLEGLGITSHFFRRNMASMLAPKIGLLDLMAKGGWSNAQSIAKYYYQPTTASRHATRDATGEILRKVRSQE